MIAAIDVGYNDIKFTALVAMVTFDDWKSEECLQTQYHLENIAPYESGQFYKRELPCITKIISTLNKTPSIIIVDGYVDLEPNHKGLGRYVYEYYDSKIPVIGVAKTKYLNSQALELCRGNSKSPLFITGAGIELSEAVEYISQMHGLFRIPTLLKKVDQLSRGK